MQGLFSAAGTVFRHRDSKNRGFLASKEGRLINPLAYDLCISFYFKLQYGRLARLYYHLWLFCALHLHRSARAVPPVRPGGRPSRSRRLYRHTQSEERTSPQPTELPLPPSLPRRRSLAFRPDCQQYDSILRNFHLGPALPSLLVRPERLMDGCIEVFGTTAFRGMVA